jgi:hypothetical protein
MMVKVSLQNILVSFFCNFSYEIGDIYDRIVLEAIRMKSDGALWPDALKCGWVNGQKRKRKGLVFDDKS